MRTEKAASSVLDNGSAMDLIDAAQGIVSTLFANIHDHELEENFAGALTQLRHARRRIDHDVQLVKDGEQR